MKVYIPLAVIIGIALVIGIATQPGIGNANLTLIIYPAFHFRFNMADFALLSLVPTAALALFGWWRWRKE